MDIYIIHRITGSIGANMKMDTYQLHLNISHAIAIHVEGKGFYNI